MKKKRTISLKAVQAALRSPKTPEHLRAGLMRKYGHLFKNAPKEWHEAMEKDSRQKAIVAHSRGDIPTAEFYRGSNYAHKLSKEIRFKNPKEATDGYISERVKSPKKFDPRSFRTKRVDSTLLTFGCPKGEWSPKKKKCKVPVELQRKLKAKRGNPVKLIKGKEYAAILYDDKGNVLASGQTTKDALRLKKYWMSGGHKAKNMRFTPIKAKRGNPVDKPELIYDKVLAIEAVKGKKSHWPYENFRHDFSSGAKIYGNPDGSLTIKGKKPLWKRKRYSESDLKELGGK